MKKRHEFEIDTRNMYDNLSTGFFDNPDLMEDNLNLLKDLAAGDIHSIREAFLSGMTMFLVPELMEQLESLTVRGTDPNPENEIEFRVIHNGKLIGVLIDSEIKW